MRDTIKKGTGDSRTLASVADFLKRYPTYEDFAAAMIAGTLPIDLGPLNDAGLHQRGTDLLKGNLLSDSTETAIWGKPEDRTPDQAFARLRELITTAQSAADAAQNTASGRIRVQTGHVNGPFSAGNSLTIATNFLPRAAIFFESNMYGFYIPNIQGNFYYLVSPGRAIGDTEVRYTVTDNSLIITAVRDINNNQNLNYIIFG